MSYIAVLNLCLQWLLCNLRHAHLSPPDSWRYRYTRKFSSSLVTAIVCYEWSAKPIMCPSSCKLQGLMAGGGRSAICPADAVSTWKDLNGCDKAAALGAVAFACCSFHQWGPLYARGSTPLDFMSCEGHVTSVLRFSGVK